MTHMARACVLKEPLVVDGWRVEGIKESSTNSRHVVRLSQMGKLIIYSWLITVLTYKKYRLTDV